MLGALVAPLVVVPLAVSLGWRAAFVVTAGIGLLWLPCWSVLVAHPQANLGPEAVSLQTGSDEAPERLRWRSHALWASLLLIFFTMPSTIFVNNFLALYLTRTYSLTQAEVGWVLWQPFLAADAGQLVGGMGVYCLLRRGWTFLSARGFLLSVGYAGAVVIVAAKDAGNAWTAVGWLCLSRFCFMAAHTALIAYAIESVTEAQTGLMTGVMNATFSASNFVFSPLIGWLADRYDYAIVISLVAWSPLLGVVSWYVLSRLHARRRAAAASKNI
jgi:ACS family hexuronate transporter-like MFS transporter